MRGAIPGIFLIAVMASAAIVDRTAVTVGNRVITESEVLRRIRLQAFQAGDFPVINDKTRREAAQRLIDLKLVDREMELGHYARTPPERAKALVDAFTAEHFQSSPDALRIALAGLQLTPDDLQAEFGEQADFLLFTSLRFKPAVDIPEQAIEDYFHAHFAPKPGEPAVDLADVRSGIEQTLIAGKTDEALDAWLKDQRERTRIVYLEKELE
ncbi:MAG TPA: hypothetical protein VGM43_21025 [Bryobacteraceae bacterium]